MAPFKQLYLTMQPFPGICGNICRRGDLPKERGELAEPFLPFLLFDCPARGGERSVHRMMEGLAYLREMNVASVLLRHVEADRTMAFHDWAEKKQYLPVIDYLKTDAAEAEILTGLTDRAEAAKLLHSWGAKEVLITHNTEVLAYDGVTTYTCPIKARNLSGRTGRGDTTFAGYITERQRAGVEEALRYCTALVSLKMETPGPFQGTRQDVLDYIREFY